MEMSIDGSFVKNMKCLQGGTRANQFWPLFFCGSCVGAPLACNLTGPRYVLIQFFFFFLVFYVLPSAHVDCYEYDLSYRNGFSIQ